MEGILAGSEGGFSPLNHVSQGPTDIALTGGLSEERDLETKPTVKYYSSGTGFYDLDATVILNFLNPGQKKTSLLLSGVEQADFNFLLTTLGLTRGNLSRHVEKLELAGYLKVEKSFNGKIPNTSYQLTSKGSKALERYWENLDTVRRLGNDKSRATN